MKDHYTIAGKLQRQALAILDRRDMAVSDGDYLKAAVLSHDAGRLLFVASDHYQKHGYGGASQLARVACEDHFLACTKFRKLYEGVTSNETSND